MNQQPLVSVLMTAYNRELYIAEAIESVLASTYLNFELIIVDDRSKDSTLSIIKSYASKDNRIKVYINEENIGDYKNRNRAASYAKGEWLMSVDSDDKINSDGIEKVLACMQEFPGSKFGMYYHLENELTELEPSIALRREFLQTPFLSLGPGATIINRAFFEQLNGYPEKYGPASDRYFNLKACSQSSIVLIPFKFFFYRRHEGQEMNNKFSYLYNNYNYLSDALKELNLFLTEKEIEWIKKKRDRRFLVNILVYFLKTRNVAGIREILRRTSFGWKEAVTGIFHFD